MSIAINYRRDAGDSKEQSPATGSIHKLPARLRLELDVIDAETIATLAEFDSDVDRDEFALRALRIGVLALRQARGAIDGDAVRREGDRLLHVLQGRLDEHAKFVQERTATTLKEYFDPQSGRLPERLERLLRQDGELEQVLRRQLGTDDSELTKTLTTYFGEESELLKWLNPDQSRGLLAAFKTAFEEQLQQQQAQVLQEFSLDHKDSALARFIDELTQRHGRLSDELKERIDTVVKEFSLDDEQSALSRLVANVERAGKTITREFSLDQEGSALSRMKSMLESTNAAIATHLSLDDESSALARLKRELWQVLESQRDQQTKFQEEVKVALQSMAARKQEAARSTSHGHEFEAALLEQLQREAQRVGDLFAPTGLTTGRIDRCKVGDAVIELGPDSAAPSARIVIEAKQEMGYTLPRAVEELDVAKRNREAQIGLFVFSRRTIPEAQEPVLRHGNDVFVAWDAEDETTDLFLRVGLTLARALCVRQRQRTESQAADFTAIEAAINRVIKGVDDLEEMEKWSTTIRNNGDKLVKRLSGLRELLAEQTEVLRQRTIALRDAVQPADAPSS